MSSFLANFSNWWLRYLLRNWPHMNVTGPYWWWINIGSGNGLVSDGTKPLPRPTLDQVFVVTWRHRATLVSGWISWWRHRMETFSALLAICAGNSPVPGEFLAQRPVTQSFDVFFDLRLNKRLSKQSWGWWFEALSRPLWRHRNVFCLAYMHANAFNHSQNWFKPLLDAYSAQNHCLNQHWINWKPTNTSQEPLLLTWLNRYWGMDM